VLHLAAAADAEVRASWQDAQRAAMAKLEKRRLLPVVLAPLGRDANLFARQRVLDEDNLAFAVVGDALRLEIERLDPKPFLGSSWLDYPGRRAEAAPARRGHSASRRGETVAMPRSSAQAMDWQTLVARSSLERARAGGPPKGKTPFAALPISQVERTAGAVFPRERELRRA
jgi:hypothetical protein